MKKINRKTIFFERRRLIKCFLSFILMAGTPTLSYSSLQGSGYMQIKEEAKTISDVVKQIETSTGYTFFYTDDLIDLKKEVNISKRNAPIESLLNQTFAGTGYSWKIAGKQIVISPSTATTSSRTKADQAKTVNQTQKIKITGVIKDANGEPIIGAGVAEEGTTNGTATDLDGNFTLNVNPGAKIKVSYIGYNTQIFVADPNQTELEIKLIEDNKLLDEVVVVGYGVQKKVNLTGSVAAISGEELSKRPVVNITQSLQGAMPGLTASVGAGSGKPGGSMNLNIRGQGNLSGDGSPYVLVDGIEMALADVNPNDVENISVLKDAAAAAIYGARAAFGVILITTKKGSTEGKANISYDGNVGWTQPVRLPEMVNSYDFATFFNAATYNAIGTKQYSDEKLELLKQYVQDPRGMNSWAELSSNRYEDFENTAKGLGNTDYFGLHYKDAAIKHSHNLSASGGSKLIQYYASMGLYNEEGILRYADMDYKRASMNANLSSQVTDWLKVKLNTKFTRSKNKTPFGDGAINEGMFFHNLARFRPTVSPYDLNGNFTELSQIPYLQSGTTTLTDNSNLNILTGAEIEPLKNWRIFLEYNYKRGTTDYEATAVAPQIVGVNGETYLGLRNELGVPAGGSFTRSNAITSYNSINVYTNYMLTLGEKHNFVGLLGFQQEQSKYSYLKSFTKDLISSATPGVSLGTGDKIPSESRSHWATRGAFGRINYDFANRYLFEANVRYDGSSRFHKDNRWGWFPSVSLGWNIAEESFMSSIRDVLTTLKLRGSYGRLGNQGQAGLYTFAQQMGVTTQGSWYFGGGRESYINAPGAINLDATWEKVESTNVAVDYSFWNNKLIGSFEVFRSTTKDMLGPSADYADMFGTSAPQANNANRRTTGWEFSINYKGNIGRDIHYSIGGMISDYKAKVTAYENPSNTNPSGAWYAGKTIGEIWGYKTDGIIQTQAEADEYNANHDNSYLTGQKWVPGDVKYRDLDGDGKVNRGTNRLGDMGDLTVIGNSTPRYSYSINGSINWKGLGLTMLWQGVGKRDYNPTGSAYFWGSSSFAQVTVFKEHMDYWRGPEDPDPNPDAYYPRPYAASAGAVGAYHAKISQTADRYILDASYIRLKNLTVSYDIPAFLVKKANINKVTVYFSGENLLTFTPMKKMFDPEGALAFGEGGKNYPLNKVYSIGLNINF